jgi:hypothetical protein
MDWAPYARIVARYIIGGIGGAAAGDAVINDPDLLNLLTMALSGIGSAAIEWLYAKAKAKGWAT